MATDGPFSLETMDKLKTNKLLPDDVLNQLSGNVPSIGGGAPAKSVVDQALELAGVQKGSPAANVVNNLSEGASKLGSNLLDQSANQFNQSPIGTLANIGKGAITGGISKISDIASGLTKPGYFDGQQSAPQVGEGSNMPAEPGQVGPNDLALSAPKVDPVDAIRQNQLQSMGSLGQAYDLQQSAALEGAQAGVRQANAEASYLGKMQENLEKQEQERATLEQDRQARLDGQLGKLNEAVNAFSAMPKTLQESFDKMGTGQKIMTGIALFLGAAPNSTGQNKAVTVMQDSLDKTIAAQKADINNKETVLGKMRSMFGDERQAEAAARLAYINNSQIKMQQIASQYKGPQIEANAKLLYGQLEVAKQKQMAEFARAAQLNPTALGADEMTKKIMALPKDLQSKAFKEKQDLEHIENQTKQLTRIFGEMTADQTMGKRVLSPVQSSSLMAKREADLFPIVKSIVGERMTDADARMLIKPSLPNLFDSEETKQRKLNDLLKALKAKSLGSTPILNGFGIRQKSFEDKYNLKPL